MDSTRKPNQSHRNPTSALVPGLALEQWFGVYELAEDVRMKYNPG